MTYQTYQERLLNEFEELTIKIDRLERYINDNKLDKTSLEVKQLNAMIVYQDILEDRIIKVMKGE